jgi:hypothetical protein
MNKQYEELSTIIRNVYDYQAVRISLYNRIVAKEYLGDEELKNNDKLTADEKAKIRKKLIDSMIAWYDEHHEIVDAPLQIRSKLKNLKTEQEKTNGPIKSLTQFNLVKDYVTIRDREKETTSLINYELKKIPIYNEFLSKVKGCGPMLSAVVITTLDPHVAPHVSSFWRYAGIDTWMNPETGERVARNNHQEQLVDRTYIDKNGKEAVRKGTTYNPAFRTKMLGVLGDCFIKCGGTYREKYDEAKYKYTNCREGWSKLRIHRAAIRIAVREFLRDLYKTWRVLEGYELEPDWWEANRGRLHGESAEPVRANANGDLLPDDVDDVDSQMNLFFGDK